MIAKLFITPLAYIKSHVNRGHTRSIRAKKNIIASLLIKGISIAISLVLVPLTINYVNTSKYGVWLTLSSIVGWFSFFDIGFGHGLRNKFTEAVAKGEEELARIYVSTTYAVLGIIISLVLVFFFCINPYLNWARILNTSPEMAQELSLLARIVFVLFCLQFVFQLVSTVLTANHEPAKASFFTLLGSFFTLAIIFILTKTTQGNLVYLGFVLSGAPVLVFIASTLWYYNHDYKKYAPSLRFVRFSFARPLLSLGGKFFIIQIGALVLFQTDNIIITQLFGPNQVTVFNVTYKLFSVISMVFMIIMSPFWSAFTEAYTKGDIEWIRSILVKMQKFWVLLCAGSILLLAVSPFIFRIWLHNTVQVPLSLSLAMSLYVSGYTWLTLYCFLLNGIGKIRVQLYLYLVSIFINIPMAILFSKIFGLAGVTLSNLLIFVVMGVMLWVQCRKILHHSASGIWDK